ncbi:threonylcarbamoyl-AMP synthase [Candidatus Micrarchaeota archaeon]|nr:threonylcarbamoyl-AMP synthase [Candidatus Micrarchaeota archaeon]
MIVSLENEYNKAMVDALSILKKAGTVIIPTDTVYGLCCDASSKDAIEKVYEIKKRDGKKPLAVLMNSLFMIKEWCEVPDEELLIEHLPGPFTFILKLKNGKELAGLKEKVGIRVPNYIFARKLVEGFGKPLALTSANLSGEKDVWSINDLDRKIANSTDLIVDGGETQFKGASTVVDLVEKKILRQGVKEFHF